VHFDVQNYEDASRCYAFILYCSDGRSTAVPESTLEQLEQLRSELKQQGVGHQGRSRSETDLTRAVFHVGTVLQQTGLSLNQSINMVAEIELATPHTIRAVYNDFVASSTVTPPSTSHRGRGNPEHPLHSNNTDLYGPTLEAETLIHTLVATQKTEGVAITSTTIRAELKDKQQIDIHRSTVRRWMHTLGYRWRHKRYIGGMKPQAKDVRIRQFIMEYAAALSEEQAGAAVIVYMDESYIHTHHASKYGWFHPNNRDVIGDADGKRLIILHAMTDCGLLAVPDEVGTNWLNEVALTAELVFEEVLEDGQDDSDYHNTMTGAKFVAWLRNRLLPTFKEMYPGKKMYLVLDNASYHKPRDESWVSNSTSQSKHDLIHKLLDLGVMELTTIAGPGKRQRVIPAHKFEASIGEGGPSKDDLLAAVTQWLKEHPDHNRSVTEQLMSDAGYTLVFTPPFCPEVQPIELLWAEIKRHVAARSTHNRSLTETREQTEEAFEKITKMFCNNIIKHCHDWIDSWLKTDAAGELQQCGSLAGVIKHQTMLRMLSALDKAATNTSAPTPIQIDPPTSAAAAPAPSTKRNLRKRH
jgi:hypothetical protein